MDKMKLKEIENFYRKLDNPYYNHKSWEDCYKFFINLRNKDIFRIIRLNGLNPYEELNKRYLYVMVSNNTKIPLKPSNELLNISNCITPQKSFNNACIIRRENNHLKERNIKKLIQKIENYFNCKVILNKHNGAYYIYNTYLTSFLDTFFKYEKSWLTMNKNEIDNYYKKMNEIFGGRMECKLPFEKAEKKVLTKKEAITDPNFGSKPDEKPVDELINYGIININKPNGPT